MPNLIFLTCPSHRILDKTQMGILPISRFRVNPLKKYYSNSNKPGPVSKPDKGKKATWKKFDEDVIAANFGITAHFPICG